MLKRLLVYVLLLVAFGLRGQSNLVPNSSFEDTLQCPDFINQTRFAIHWSNPSIDIRSTSDLLSVNYCPTYINSDIIELPDNSYLGYQQPRTGNNVAGIITFTTDSFGVREYIQVHLTEKLAPQKIYCIKFYASLAEKYSRYAVNNLGAAFSIDSLSYSDATSLLNLNALFSYSDIVSDTSAWVEISGYFTANGGEEFMILGTFAEQEGIDTLLMNSDTPEKVAYYYIDDVSVFRCDLPVEENVYLLSSIYPNPATNSVSIDIPKSYPNPQLYIYNLTGQLVATKPVQPNQPLPITELNTGVYIFAIQSNNTLIGREKVVVY